MVVVYYPPELLPGYCALFREAGGVLNFCALVLPGARCANADLCKMHDHLVRDYPYLRTALGQVRAEGGCKARNSGWAESLGRSPTIR